MVYKSEDSVLLYKEEVDQGSIVTPDSVLSPIQDEIDLPDPEFDYEEEYYIGDGQTAGGKFKGQEDLSGGTLPVKVTQPLELYLLLGNKTVDTGTTTLKLKENDYPPSISLGAEMNGFKRVFTGVTATSGELNVTSEDQLQLDLDIDALGVDTTQTISEPTGENYDTKPTFDFNTTVSNLTISGNEFARLTDLTISINRNTSMEYYINNTSGAFEILYGRPEITMDATLKVADDKIYQELLDGQVKFTTSIAFENSYYNLNIELQKCNIRSAPMPIPAEGAVESDVTIVAEDIEITFDKL